MTKAKFSREPIGGMGLARHYQPRLPTATGSMALAFAVHWANQEAEKTIHTPVAQPAPETESPVSKAGAFSMWEADLTNSPDR